MTSTLTPVSVPRDTQVSTVMEVSVSYPIAISAGLFLILRVVLFSQKDLANANYLCTGTDLIYKIPVKNASTLYKIAVLCVCFDLIYFYVDVSLLYFGIALFTDVDECVSAPCQNSGSCIDQINGYLCQCAPGYTDLQCQTGTHLIL